MTRARHLSTAALLRASGRGAAEVAPAARRHLDGCAACWSLVRDLGVLRSMLREGAAEPPGGVVARAWALMEPRPVRRGGRWGFDAARLVFDSAGPRVAAGVRAAVAAHTQLWRTRRADVDVRVEGPGLGSRAVLLGQVLPRGRGLPPVKHGMSWLCEPGRRPRWSALGPRGEFSFPAPRSRRWTLWLEWGGLRLRLDSSR